MTYLGKYGLPDPNRAVSFSIGSTTGHNGQRAGQGNNFHAKYNAAAGTNVLDVDDLNFSDLAHNFFMDSGSSATQTVAEQYEPAQSNVTAAPLVLANEVEQDWTPRNILFLRAILPYQP